MTVEELHKILDNADKEISIKEFQEILYQLKTDTFYERTKNIDMQSNKYQWYLGEANGFQIALDLSEHLISINPATPKYKIGDKVSYYVYNNLYQTEVESIKVKYKRNGNIKIQYAVVSPDGFRNYKNEIDLFQTKEQKEKANGQT